MSGLTFNELRKAHEARIPEYRNAKGELTFKNGIDAWLLSQWMNALTGEVGEAANLIKKVDRGDFSFDEVKDEIGKELADIMGYLDLVALRAGIDLGQVTIQKFNEISKRIGSQVYLGDSNDR